MSAIIKKSRLAAAVELIKSGIIRPEEAERLMNTDQIKIKDPAMGSGSFVVEALNQIFPTEPADVEDVDLVDRCEQLEAQVDDLRRALRMERENCDLWAANAEARNADATRWAGHAGKYSAEVQELRGRLTAQNHAVECAMRYVKVQSARYQRELLQAIDELERCPK